MNSRDSYDGQDERPERPEGSPAVPVSEQISVSVDPSHAPGGKTVHFHELDLRPIRVRGGRLTFRPNGQGVWECEAFRPTIISQGGIRFEAYDAADARVLSVPPVLDSAIVGELYTFLYVPTDLMPQHWSAWRHDFTYDSALYARIMKASAQVAALV